MELINKQKENRKKELTKEEKIKITEIFLKENFDENNVEHLFIFSNILYCKSFNCESFNFKQLVLKHLKYLKYYINNTYLKSIDTILIIEDTYLFFNKNKLFENKYVSSIIEISKKDDLFEIIELSLNHYLNKNDFFNNVNYLNFKASYEQQKILNELNFDNINTKKIKKI